MRILLAIDHSKYSKEAIRRVIAQVRAQGTEVAVLHVVEPITAYISVGMIPHYVPHVAEIEEDRRKQAKSLVEPANFVRQALELARPSKRETRS